MKKRKLSIKELKPNKIGFKSSVSIFKEKFSENEITFKPRFSITKNIAFSNIDNVSRKLAKAFKNIKLLKF